MPAIISDVPRIALIHSTQGHVDPVERAFADHWPEVERITLLDDALNLQSRPAAGAIFSSAALFRFKELTDYAVSMCVQGILYTCSQFGEAIEAAREHWRMPILKPQEALLLSALEHGSRLGLVTARESDIEALQREFFDLAEETGATIELATLCLPEAAHVNGSQSPELDELLRERTSALQACDAIMVPDFAGAAAAPVLRRVLDRPVLAAPDASVLLLKQLLSVR